jgi:hypothetical protein
MAAYNTLVASVSVLREIGGFDEGLSGTESWTSALEAAPAPSGPHDADIREAHESLPPTSLDARVLLGRMAVIYLRSGKWLCPCPSRGAPSWSLPEGLEPSASSCSPWQVPGCSRGTAVVRAVGSAAAVRTARQAPRGSTTFPTEPGYFSATTPANQEGAREGQGREPLPDEGRTGPEPQGPKAGGRMVPEALDAHPQLSWKPPVVVTEEADVLGWYQLGPMVPRGSGPPRLIVPHDGDPRIRDTQLRRRRIRCFVDDDDLERGQLLNQYTPIGLEQQSGAIVGRDDHADAPRRGLVQPNDPDPGRGSEHSMEQRCGDPGTS